MKTECNLFTLLAFLVQLCSLLWLLVAADSIDRLSLGQAAVRLGVGVAIFGAAAGVINFVGRRDKHHEQTRQSKDNAGQPGHQCSNEY